MIARIAAAAAALTLCSAAHAGVLTYSGYLQTAAGQPVTTATTITFRFYPGPAGGTPVWEDVVTVVPGVDGWFSAVLGATGTNPLDATDFAQPLWLALQVASETQEMYPRTQLGTAPYALTVDWSGVAGKPSSFPVDPALVQTRVAGACPDGEFMTGVNENGTVTCGADTAGVGTITSVAAGTGLTGGGTTGSVTLAVNTGTIQARVTAACPAGQYMTGVNQNGTVVCAVDQSNAGDVTSVVAGSGLTGGGVAGDVALAVDTSVVQARVAAPCAVGSSIRVIDAGGNVTCQPNAAYAAGTGLALAGSTFSVDGTVVARKDGAAGDQTFDGGTLHLDYANNRVGVNTTAPANALDVVGTAAADAFAFRAPKGNQLRFHASALAVSAGPAPAVYSAGLYMGPVSATSSSMLTAPVRLPAGSTINELDCEVYDNDGTADLDPGLSRATVYSRAAGATTAQAIANLGLGTSGASASLQQKLLPLTTPVTVYFYYDYWLYVSFAGGTSPDLRFYGCRILYSAPGPAY